MANIDEKQITRLVEQCLDSFKNLPRLIELDVPEGESLVIVGDTHGDVDGVKAIVGQFLEVGDRGKAISPPNKTRLLFLGDYVDRDERDLENLVYILALALRHPTSVFLLRGNHEENYSNRAYGFLDNLERLGMETWYPSFERIYTLLPLACHVRNQGVLCCHGMIPVMPGVVKLRDIARLPAAARLEQWDPVTTQLLWSDPDPDEQPASSESIRGVGLTVGKNDIDKFLAENRLRLIVRSHQAFPAGHRFFFQRRVLSIFSKPNYGMYQNAASIAQLYGDGRVDVLSKANGDERFTIAEVLKLV